MATGTQYYGTGKRKSSVARVYLRPGNGEIMINRKSLDDYFGDDAQKTLVRQALDLTETTGKFNVLVTVSGGGITGQATAIRHGISRALSLVPQEEYRGVLKKAGLLTRDAREVERKKYGQPGARKRYQYSKR
ncbi:MAG: 30S ribosomal protein S9 [Deltaproteobacteria bacterium]|nr:30S ribosomal protein S9 [Deltaproteobacteria bacterium]